MEPAPDERRATAVALRPVAPDGGAQWLAGAAAGQGALMARVLVACEFSGIVRRAFAARGHDAWLCDLRPAEDGSNRHIRADVRREAQMFWGAA